MKAHYKNVPMAPLDEPADDGYELNDEQIEQQKKTGLNALLNHQNYGPGVNRGGMGQQRMGKDVNSKNSNKPRFESH